jgi:hypothetical protein
MNNNNRILKPSLYNIIITKTDGIVIYNTKTGCMTRCFDERSAVIEQLLRSDEYTSFTENNDINNDIIVKLYKQGYLIDSQCDELSEMKVIEKNAIFDNYLKLIILPTESFNFRCVY